MGVLLEKLAEMGRNVSTTKSLLPQRSTEQLQSDYAATDSLLIVATGTVLNILKSRQHGNSLHVIVRHGEVSLTLNIICVHELIRVLFSRECFIVRFQ